MKDNDFIISHKTIDDSCKCGHKRYSHIGTSCVGGSEGVLCICNKFDGLHEGD